MNDPLLVRGFKGFRDLRRDGQRFVNGDRATRNPLRQVLALHEFHHEGVNVTRLFEPVNDRDVGMIQRGEGLGFTLEASETVGVMREFLGEDLDRHVAIQPGVARAIDLPHSAFANRRADFVNAQTSTGSEGQEIWFIIKA